MLLIRWISYANVGIVQDNVRGPLLPVLCEELGIPFSYGGLFLTLGNLSAVISTLLMGKALQRYSEKRVTLVICAFSALAGIFAPMVNSLTNLLLLGLVLGASVALMGSICNILTLKGSAHIYESDFIDPASYVWHRFFPRTYVVFLVSSIRLTLVELYHSCFNR